MPTHWESSKKPLFIKMIWKNGQHHALLKKEESMENLNMNAVNFNQKNIRMVKSAINKTPKNLNVTSVKLLQSAKQSTRQSCQNRNSAKLYKTPVTDRGTSMLKKKSITKKFVEEQSKRNATKKEDILDFVITPTPLDINNVNPLKNETSKTIPRFSVSMNIPKNSLSERVMVWLDLATQNQNCNKTLQKVASVSAMENKSHTTFGKFQKSLSCSFDMCYLCKDNKDEFYIEGVNVNVPLPKSILQNREISNESDMNMTDNNLLSDTFYKDPLISSESEENITVDINESILPKKIFLKRQLHVFIPSLGKNITDCDTSLFSSSLSGYSITQTYI